MAKELAELSFDELVKLGINKELDAIVTGESLHSRVYSLMELAARWRFEKTKAEETK
jgi:hypothetical protein